MYTTELPYNYQSEQAKTHEVTYIRNLIRECKVTDKPLLTRALKRLIDLLVAGAATVLLLSWLIPVVALVVWLETGESVFFIQKRNGLHGKLYSCIKFRTMYRNPFSDYVSAVEGDSRITKAGHFLRITGIDELPQLLNVLVGDMSLVGPRPHMVKDNETFSEKIEGYEKRHLVRPGITGLAQVKGFKGPLKEELDIYRRIENDIRYVQNYSVGMDIRIMGLTIIHMAREMSKL